MPAKVATRSSVEQIARLDRMLRIGASMDQMTQSLGCCEKTVRRHLAWMCRKFEVRIVRAVSCNGTSWRYRDGSPLIFTAEATRALQ
jgi:DNA-binding NarL/FixJ family response regulator